MASKRQKMLFYLTSAFFLILGIYSLYGGGAGRYSSLSAEDAVRFSIEDASKAYGTAAVFKIVSVSCSGGNKCNVVLEAIKNGHSACPTVDLLEYSLMPIASRPAKPIIGDCNARPAFRPEQALINSAKHASVYSFVANGAFGCAFKLPIASFSEARSYCSLVDSSGIQSFASSNSLPAGAWVAQWTLAGESKFVGLDSTGNVIASG